MTVATLDPRALRDAFGAFVTGVTIVTTRDDAESPLASPQIPSLPFRSIRRCF